MLPSHDLHEDLVVFLLNPYQSFLRLRSFKPVQMIDVLLLIVIKGIPQLVLPNLLFDLFFLEDIPNVLLVLGLDFVKLGYALVEVLYWVQFFKAELLLPLFLLFLLFTTVDLIE